MTSTATAAIDATATQALRAIELRFKGLGPWKKSLPTQLQPSEPWAALRRWLPRAKWRGGGDAR